MPPFGLQFASGAVFPACPVHIDRRFPDFVAVQFMRAGSLYFQRGPGPVREWRQPLFFWTDQASHYRYGPGATGSWDHRWVQFRGPACRHHLLPLLEALAPEGVAPVVNADEVDTCIRELIDRVQHVPEDAAGCVHRLHRLLAVVHTGKTGSPAPDPRIDAVRKELDVEPGADWDFSALARRHGFSYSRFRLRFREETGTSPARYLTVRRLREAARLLASSDLPAREIGERVGYPDPAHFSKAFKRWYGASPRACRKSAAPFRPETEDRNQ